MRLAKIERYQYSKHFIPVLESNHRYLVLFGGRGGSKTNQIILKLLNLSCLDEHIHIVYCRHQKRTLRDTTFQDIVNYIKNSKYKDIFEYSEAYNSSMIFTNKITGHKLVPFGLADEENTKGISEATHVWIDEVDKCTEDQVTMINSVLRTPNAKKLQLIVSFNPISQRHWLRKFFFSEEDAYKPHPRFGNDILVHHSTYKDNEFINHDEYLKTLSLNYSGRQNLLNVNVHGFWGAEENKSPFFYALDETKHYAVNDIIWNKSDVLYLAFDFNISPMTCVVAQLKPGVYLNIIKSYKIRNITIKEFCGQIKRDFPGAIFKVTADPAGNSRSVGYDSVTTTMHSIIRQSLNIGLNQMDKPMLNWNRRDAWQEIRIFCNSVLQHHPNINISPKAAIELINDLEMATTIENEDKLYKTSGDTEFGMHLTDCFIYLLTTYFNTYLKRQL